MNINQIMVLNRALDGEDIYGLPSFTREPISSIQIELVKNDLCRMGVLNSHTTFTNEGAALTRKIQDYKAAKKYIHFNHMIIALINDVKAIVMKQNNEDISFTTVVTENFLEQLSHVYKFLLMDSESEHSKTSHCTLKEIFLKYKIKPYNSFTLKTNKKDESLITNELFFESKRQLYVFQSDNNELTSMSSKDVREMLRERLRVLC
ncbi:MAG TPA: DUF5081 family protein [Clostridiales bacterium]|nr:DUF5081 family protein [Clostridiales bacterium]